MFQFPQQHNGGSSTWGQAQQIYQFNDGPSTMPFPTFSYWQNVHEPWLNPATRAPPMMPAVVNQHQQPLSQDMVQIESGGVDLLNHQALFQDMVQIESGGVDLPNHQALSQDIVQIESGRVELLDYQALPQDMVQIESGRVEFPNHPVDMPVQNGSSSASVRPSRAKRKPWTIEEHMLFLLGIERYGKGNWKNISRHVVQTRTMTQVASHAQKHFKRQNIPKEERRRKSIHDITLSDLVPHYIDQQNSTPHLDFTVQHLPEMQPTQDMFQWNPPNNMAHQMSGFGYFDNGF